MANPERERRVVAPPRLTEFFVFWLIAAAVFAVVGVATLVGVSHGHRLGAFFVLLGALCLLPGYAIRRVGRR